MSAPYDPTPELQRAIGAFKEAERAYEQARENLRTAIADELRNVDVTVPRLTKELPWSEEVVRRIARNADIPRRREPTVTGIKATAKVKGRGHRSPRP